MVPQQRIELRIDAYKATVIPFNYKGETGGDEWIRATNLLRMKELHYRCATSPIGSTGRDRTSDQLINSQLHYRCATVE